MSEAGKVITDIFENYHITATVGSHHVDFRVVSTMDTEAEDPADSDLFLTGSVKWDGCSNWDFHTSECMAHFCGRKGATGMGRLMDRLYDITAEHLATFEKDLAE